MWLNLYGHEAVWRNLQKQAKNAFFVFLGHSWTQGPIHEIFVKKYWELAELENDILFCFVFVFLNENHHGFHMRYRLFLHYEWFLQNLEKLICTRLLLHKYIIPSDTLDTNENKSNKTLGTS